METCRIYTAQEVYAIQDEGVGGNDLNLAPASRFILTTLSLREITGFGEPITRESVIAGFEDERVCKLCRLRYQAGLRMGPLVVDRDNDLLDGFHRYLALSELGVVETPAFRQI